MMKHRLCQIDGPQRRRLVVDVQIKRRKAKSSQMQQAMNYRIPNVQIVQTTSRCQNHAKEAMCSKTTITPLYF